MRKYKILSQDHTARYVQFEGDLAIQIQDLEDPIHDQFDPFDPVTAAIAQSAGTPFLKPLLKRSELH